MGEEAKDRLKEAKDRLKASVFEYLDHMLPDHVKRKLTPSETSQLVDIIWTWAEEIGYALGSLKEPTVVHRTTSSFNRDEEPAAFLDDLSKV